MTEKTIGVGDIIKDFNEELQQYVVTMPDGNQIPITQLNDKVLVKHTQGVVRGLKRKMVMLLHYQREIKRRGLEHPRSVNQLDGFSIVHYAMVNAVKVFNGGEEE